MPDKQKQQQGRQTTGTVLPDYDARKNSRRNDPELNRIQAVLKDCGSEFGNIRRGNRE